jgi:stage V sporulation protein G
MEITEVKVFPVNEDKLKAYVTIIFDNCFVVRDLKIINGNTGLFVAMPSKKRKDGTFRDIAHPLNADMRNAIEKKILLVYEQELKSMTENAQKSMEALGKKRSDDEM